MANGIDLDAVITFRRQGLLWSDIAKRLNTDAGKIKRICLSKSYKKRSREWLQDSKLAMDMAFNHYAQIAAKNALAIYEKALEMMESESPRVQVEGLKLAYQMTKDTRTLVMSERVIAVEEKLSSLEEDG